MAKINFGAITNDARGKIRGNVFSKNKSGAYIRGKVTPANPRSIPQTFVRNNFGILAQQWSGTLTDSQRAAWIAYAQTYPRLDIFGASIQLSGLNMFISLNQVEKQIGHAISLTPPASNVVAPIPIDTASFEFSLSSTRDFSQTAAAVAANDHYYLFATRGLPVGRTVQKNDYRFIGSQAAAIAPFPALIDLSAYYSAVFGTPILGQRVGLLVATVDIASGLTTVGVAMDTIVVA